VSRLLCALGLLAAAVAWAGPPSPAKIEAEVMVVRASNDGNAVDPALAEVIASFAKEHFAFTSYKLLSSKRMTLEQGKPVEVSVASHSKLMLTLNSVKDGKAKVTAAVENGPSVSYELGRQGRLLINAGHVQNSELFVMVSSVAAAAAPAPAQAPKPRRPFGVSRPALHPLRCEPAL
jgi:hypothetical protein